MRLQKGGYVGEGPSAKADGFLYKHFLRRISFRTRFAQQRFFAKERSVAQKAPRKHGFRGAVAYPFYRSPPPGFSPCGRNLFFLTASYASTVAATPTFSESQLPRMGMAIISYSPSYHSREMP